MSGPISLNIEPKFSLTETAATAGNGITTGLNWVIDKVKFVATAILSFLRDTALPFAKLAANKTVTFLNSYAGGITTGGSATLGLLYAASTVDGEKNRILQVGLLIGAAASAGLTITAIVFGAQTGFNTSIIG